MKQKMCSCESPSLLRGSILCDSCHGLVVDPEVAHGISSAADSAAAALDPTKESETVSIDVLPDGGHRIIDSSTLLSGSSVFTLILPADSELLTWLLKAAATGVVSFAVKRVIEEILRQRRNEREIEEACIAIFGEYFGLEKVPRLSNLAHRNSFARIFKDVIEKHTKTGALEPEVEALCRSEEDLLSELADEHPTSTLLRATIQLVRSKLRATFGNLSGAYSDLHAIWNCRHCTETLEKHLGQTGCLILLRQILNHSYLLSGDHLGRLDWDTYGYSMWIQEAQNRMGMVLGDDLPPPELDHWSKFGEIGPGLGLHFGNAALHKRIDANDMDEARQALETRFALARAWDDATPSVTSWNQFSQIAGQALIIGDASLPVDILGHASKRAGRTDYPPGRKSGLIIKPNPAAEKMDPFALEWLLHLALRDQAAGSIRPDMSEGEGSLVDIERRLNRMARPSRFRRVSQAIYCRVYPEQTSEAKPDAFFPDKGYGTGIFLPLAPRQFPVGG